MQKSKIKILSKSPFMMGLVGGTGAVVADLVWLAGELSLHFGLISESSYLLVRFGVFGFLVIAVVLCILAGKYYLQNGYYRADNEVVKLHKRRENTRVKLQKLDIVGGTNVDE